MDRTMVSVLILALDVLLPASSAHAQTYTVRELAPASGDGATYARDVNGAGLVLGAGVLPSGNGTQALLYDQSGLVGVLSALPGTDLPFVWPGAVNEAGSFVGTEILPNLIGTTARAFVSSLDLIPTRYALFAQTGRSGATDINNASPPYSVGLNATGQFYGQAQWSVHHAYAVRTDAQNNPISDLGTLGGPFSRAEAINDSGDVVGVSLSSAGPLHAFLAPAGGPLIDLGTLGGPVSWALGINNAGVVVGWSRLPDGSARAFRHVAGAMGALPGLAGDYAQADAINSAGTIVGMALDGQGRPRAVVFDAGAAIDLNSRIAPGSGWILQHARAINDSGVIVGWGRHDGRARGFILQPVAICFADCDGSGTLNISDFICFQTRFALGDPYADCDGNGVRNINDFICFQTRFAVGCP